MKTYVLSEDKRERARAMVEKELGSSRGVFIVYPLIEESETPGLRNATAHGGTLAEFGISRIIG